jgi:hypothetical protein
MAFLSSAFRFPVVARHRASRIFFENSGVIGSLGELIPNISISSNYVNVYIYAAKIIIIFEMASKRSKKVATAMRHRHFF